MHYRRRGVAVRQIRVARALPLHGPSVAAAAHQRRDGAARATGGNRHARPDGAASVGDRVRTRLACAAAHAAGRPGVEAGLAPSVDLSPTASRRSITCAAEAARASGTASDCARHTADPARPRHACRAATPGGYVERRVQSVAAAPRPQDREDQDSNPEAHARSPRIDALGSATQGESQRWRPGGG
jgi:hypothetical protein